MSAYTHTPPNPIGPGQVISIAPGHPAPPEHDALNLLTQQIESALAMGKEQCRKLREDIHALQSRYQNEFAEADRKLQHAKSREQQLAQNLAAQHQAYGRREQILQSEIKAQRERSDTLQTELDQALKQVDRTRTEARQKMETLSQQLVAQRDRTEALQRDLEQTLKQMAQNRDEARQRDEAGAARETKLTSEIKSLRATHDLLKNSFEQLQGRAAHLQQNLEKNRAEVELYKSSWARVLQMEREARAHLDAKNEVQSKIAALESRNNDLMSEAKTRVRELEASLRSAQSELEKNRQLAASAAEAADSERKTSAEERANTGCALRTVEEERARTLAAQNAALHLRKQAQAAIESARAQAASARAEAHAAVTAARDRAQTAVDNAHAQVLAAGATARAEAQIAVTTARTEAQTAVSNAREQAQEAIAAARGQSHIAVTRAQEHTKALEAENAALKQQSAHLERELKLVQERVARAAAAPGSAARATAHVVGAPVSSATTLPAATPAPDENFVPEIEIEITDLDDDFQRLSSSRTQLEAERDTLKTQLSQAVHEMKEIRQNSDRMRRHYPLRDLLAHKETELTAAVRHLKKIDRGAPAREKAEAIVETLSEQREQLRNLLRGSDLANSPGASSSESFQKT